MVPTVRDCLGQPLASDIRITTDQSQPGYIITMPTERRHFPTGLEVPAVFEGFHGFSYGKQTLRKLLTPRLFQCPAGSVFLSLGSPFTTCLKMFFSSCSHSFYSIPATFYSARQKPTRLVRSTRQLFSISVFAPHCNLWRSSSETGWNMVLSNFSLYFMYKRMSEWCGHTDVILF